MTIEKLRAKGTNPAVIYEGLNCRESGAQMEATFCKGGGAGMRNFPWIKIGHIYTNIAAESGGWTALIAHLVAKGERRFVVLSGRHGDVFNIQMPNLFVSDFYREDAARARKIENGKYSFTDDERVTNVNPGIEMPGKVEIEVIDMGSFQNQATAIQAQARLAKQSGKTLILGWCFSLFAFSVMSQNKAVELQTEEFNHKNEPLAKGIVGFGYTSMQTSQAVTVRKDAVWTVKRHHLFCYPVRNHVMDYWMWALS